MLNLISKLKGGALNVLRFLLSFLSAWPEVLGIPLAIMLWFMIIPFLLVFDRQAGIVDVGVFHVIVVGLIKALVASAAAWTLIRFQFGPAVYKYLAQGFKHDFTNPLNGEKCERSRLALWLLSLYFLAFVLSM
jgi:hypothetical protein